MIVTNPPPIINKYNKETKSEDTISSFTILSSFYIIIACTSKS